MSVFPILSHHYTDSKGSKKPIQITFTPLEKDGEGAELLSKDTFEIRYKDYPPIKAEGRLYRKIDRELTQSGPDRNGGVLVYADDKTVLELSLFNFDEATHGPYVRQLFGYLKLDIANILRHELREADHRLALIEDDRSQLKRRTEFYEMLKVRIEPWLRPWVDAERERTAQTRAVEVTSRWNRQLRPLFREINSVIHQKTAQSGAQVKGAQGTPPEIMEFARNKVTTSAGTVYRIDLLFNTNAVPSGSRIVLESNNPSITVQPFQDLTPVPNHQTFADVARMVVRISAEREGQQAIVTAIVPGYATSSLIVESVEPDVYFPHEGIEWWPSAFEAVGGRLNHPTLWVDLTRVTDEDLIRISSLGNVVEVLDTEFNPTDIPILKQDVTTGTRIGRVRPRFRVNGHQGQGTLEATWESLRDELTFDIVDPREPRVSGNWMFNGIDFEEGPEDLDVYPNPEGKVILNVRHSLISSYFGTSAEVAVNTVKTDATRRLLAAHLVVDCILNDLSRKAWRNEHGPNANMEIGTRDPSQMDWQVYTYVMRLKAQYGVRWTQSLIDVLGG